MYIHIIYIHIYIYIINPKQPPASHRPSSHQDLASPHTAVWKARKPLPLCGDQVEMMEEVVSSKIHPKWNHMNEILMEY